MFGLFKPKYFDDPDLGRFKRRGREWIGSIELPGEEPVELALEGSRETPSPVTLAAAKELPNRLPSLVPDISRGLFEHLEPYLDALNTEPDFAERLESPDDLQRILAISSAEQAWSSARLIGVEVVLEKSKTRVLIKMATPWDIEHTLGAYFDDWVFQELNGSV